MIYMEEDAIFCSIWKNSMLFLSMVFSKLVIIK